VCTATIHSASATRYYSVSLPNARREFGHPVMESVLSSSNAVSLLKAQRISHDDHTSSTLFKLARNGLFRPQRLTRNSFRAAPAASPVSPVSSVDVCHHPQVFHTSQDVCSVNDLFHRLRSLLMVYRNIAPPSRRRGRKPSSGHSAPPLFY
jgi:hypothetical protein